MAKKQSKKQPYKRFLTQLGVDDEWRIGVDGKSVVVDRYKRGSFDRTQVFELQLGERGVVAI